MAFALAVLGIEDDTALACRMIGTLARQAVEQAAVPGTAPFPHPGTTYQSTI
jgi:hypothetical protein